MEQDTPYCCYCGEIVFLRQLTREHLVPRSWGGNSSNFNLKPCCYSCNQKRKNKSLRKWLLELQNELKHSTNPQHRYKLTAMIENVGYWINYIEKHNVRLYWPDKQWLLKEKEVFAV